MTTSEIAKRLGRKGGLKRAQRLPEQRRKEIARLGAKARIESLRLARMVQINFDYVVAIQKLHPPKPCVSQSAPKGRVPGIYEKKT
jgi:hypothetical protein